MWTTLSRRREARMICQKKLCAHFEENYLAREALLGRKIMLELTKRDSGRKVGL